MKRVNKEKVSKLIAKGNAILVDMRSPVSFRDGHIEGAVNLPLKNFTNLLMKTDRKTAVIVYADTLEDKEMASGCNYAEVLGFTEIYYTDYTSLR